MPRAHPRGSGRGSLDRPPPHARARARRSGDLRGRRSARAGHDHIRPQARPSSHLRGRPRAARPKQTRSRRRGCTPCRATSMRNGRIFSRGPRPGSGEPCAHLARGRRRPWLVAGGLAGVVLAGGLLWPTGGGGPATAEVPVETRRPHPTPTPRRPLRRRARRRSHPSRAARNPTWPSIAAELLSARTECGSDQACLEHVVEIVDAPLPGGVVDLAAADRTVTLLDEFGGAAVLRVEASPAQLRRRSSSSSCAPTTGGCSATSTTSRSSDRGDQIPSWPSNDASSRRFFTVVRKRAASAPSTMRWSYDRAR